MPYLHHACIHDTLVVALSQLAVDCRIGLDCCVPLRPFVVPPLNGPRVLLAAADAQSPLACELM
jgi:hypothetical protein